ncbi:MAG: hypothetical protein PPHEESC_1896 [uncultured Paraburkholderia sp.]|nr:MAG: hypothetical protein PPHEESC_1896 [uncultured Paraburkholderia sp.]
MKKIALAIVAALLTPGTLLAQTLPDVGTQPQVESSSKVLIADEKSGSWWGYGQNGRVTLCTRDGADALSPDRSSQCKPKESGTPALWQVMHSGDSFATGHNNIALVSLSVGAALVSLDGFKWQRQNVR